MGSRGSEGNGLEALIGTNRDRNGLGVFGTGVASTSTSA